MIRLKFFERFSSNTCAGSGNQFVFYDTENTVKTGRIFYRIFCEGEYNYSLLFSNITDSTFADGSESHKNLVCDEWTILSAKIGKADKNYFGTTADVRELEGFANEKSVELIPITFNGSTSKNVAPGEFFSTDPVKMYFDRGDYLCLEITFCGRMIPYHEESLLPVFEKTENGFVYSKKMPFASMIGCDRKVKSKIAFLGDSITQGIGTALNSYAHWNALLSDKIGSDYAFWNLGLGFARASDMASDGAWAFKAKQNDTVIVCYGVNDILRGANENQVIRDIEKIVDNMKNNGKKIVLQTVPPFNYTEEKIAVWENVNKYINDVLSDKADLVFDTVSVLSESTKEPHKAKYGGHPDETGCAVWADALYTAICNAGLIGK